MKEIKSVKEVVESCLKENEKARNSDWTLFNMVCQKYHIDTSKVSVQQMCENGKDFPSFESVTRCRRKFQESGKYLPSEEVDKFRTQQEFDFRKEFA